ncbi:alpha/beta hydrolase fold domain-containing protein [Streptomyces sp. NBC_01549]|nr:alpha/beta hydrolase fold domain-containing protein [Streptomyces sp. NBC_01549]
MSGTLGELALAAGYVVVQPGARGRTLVNSSGEYYGTAPAAIVDLKAVVRYVRYNAGTIPGDTDKIVTAGTSAGGALSALLGASGGASSLYDDYLSELGAVDADDVVYATGALVPHHRPGERRRRLRVVLGHQRAQHRRGGRPGRLRGPEGPV